MALAPMPGEVEAPLKADSPRWMADEPHVQPDRHHLRLPVSLVAQHVEGIAHETEPLLRRAHPAGVFAVIIGKRIRDDEVPLALDRLPEWQLVTVVIAVVEETPPGCGQEGGG